jgi:RNA polymerase sigma-54 factor
MKQGLGMHLTQQQKLVMTQQLQQAIKLLQLGQMELAASIEEELTKNPTLEEIPGTEDRPMSDAEMKLNEKALQQERDDSEQRNGSDENIDWEKFIEAQRDDRGARNGPTAGHYDDLPPIETTLSTTIGLVEHLSSQIGTQLCTDAERRSAVVMIMNLNEHGWLECTLDYVAEEAEADMDDVEGALMIVQALDPIGCGALDLKDCLIIQVKHRWPEDPFFPEIVQNHLEHFESRNYSAVARAMDMDMEDVLEYHKMLRECDPWPARPFIEDSDQYITPDIEVVKVGGEWKILQGDDGLPRLRVSDKYLQMLQDDNKEDKKFVEERLKAAKFLVESIFKRQRTIYKVMEAILRRQRDFFEHGAEWLRPMVLRDIADEIGVHESTVSRATSNKYVQCPHGIFELKYFFNAAIKRTTGGDLGSEAVKEKIRRLISDEDKDNPYSDSGLAKMLKTHSIKIARRTVAKYREAMGILPSTQRKKMF